MITKPLEDASICRIWRTEIDPRRAADYTEFTRMKSVPMFRAQRGFVAVMFASKESQRAVITLWRDRESIDALSTSVSYLATVKEIEATGFLRGSSTVEVFMLDAVVGAHD